MKVLPLHCKWLDLRVARMTTKMAVQSPVGDVKNSVLRYDCSAKYIDTQRKYILLFIYLFIYLFTFCFLIVRCVSLLSLFFAGCAQRFVR